MDRVVVTSPDELLAALPHVLGFKPEESIVTVPLGGGLPVARIDIPQTPDERRQVLGSLGAAYARNVGQPGSMLAIVCVTEDGRSAETASRILANDLNQLGIGTPIRLWAIADRWTDLNSGDTGARSAESTTRMAAEAAFLGRPQPAPSRGSLADALTGDRAPVDAVLHQARTVAQQEPPEAQHDWAVGRLAQFHTDGRSLSDADAARILVALESTPTRDALWGDMSRENSTRHVELWSDLTSRAPDEVRTPAASLLAFSSWLQGDGAKAWVALDQIPADAEPYAMANLTTLVLEQGIHPDLFEDAKETFVESEAFIPDGPAQNPHRAIPTGVAAPDRRAPGI